MGQGYHLMQPHETLNAVARTYGVDVKSLVRWNKIKDPDKVQICQKIWLKAPPQVTPKGVAPKPVQHSTAKGQATASDGSESVHLLESATAAANRHTDPANPSVQLHASPI